MVSGVNGVLSVGWIKTARVQIFGFFSLTEPFVVTFNGNVMMLEEEVLK